MRVMWSWKEEGNVKIISAVYLAKIWTRTNVCCVRTAKYLPAQTYPGRI